MPEAGPGKFGGSRDTVRKRAQRKRKASREREASLSKPVVKEAPKKEGKTIEHQIELLAYEAVAIATQLRKLLNKRAGSFKNNDSIIQDINRAEKILKGAVKENTLKQKYEKEN